jgi:hypothetical protein
MLRSLSKIILFAACSAILISCGVNFSGRPPFEELAVSPGYKHISMPDGRTWNVIFELPNDSTFSGVVRHTSLWYDASIPFMSHDILVTTGDFTSREAVNVSVMGHKFFYSWDDGSPVGTINLLHILPANATIFDQLKEIRKWSHVSIRGREIYKIEEYDADGTYRGYFQDAGCNTILVTSVTINAVGTPIP